MHPRLEDILAYNAAVRADLANVIASTPAEAFTHHPPGGGWCGAELVFHMGRTEGATTKMLEGLFAKALADGLAADTETTSLVHSLDYLRVPDRHGRRFEAPERLRPPADADLASSWESLRTVRERTDRAVASEDGLDLTKISAPHPIFGPINGYQWILFIGLHEERHLNQLKETLNGA